MNGSFTRTQLRALAPFVEGKRVHDLGAGRLLQAIVLAGLGAKEVVAVDQLEYMAELCPPLPSSVRFVRCAFEDYEEPIETAFVSWPVNWNVGFDRLLRTASTVIYLGQNFDGTACGAFDFWSMVLSREVLAHVPRRRNTLIVYGSEHVRRERLPEEWAAMNRRLDGWFTAADVYSPNTILEEVMEE